MGFFFKNKKKNKEEETVTPVVETTPEVPAKEGMILVREGIKLGLPTVSMEEAIVAAGELLRDLGYVRFKTFTGRPAFRIFSENQSQFVACSGKSPVCLKLNGFKLNVRDP